MSFIEGFVVSCLIVGFTVLMGISISGDNETKIEKEKTKQMELKFKQDSLKYVINQN